MNRAGFQYLMRIFVGAFIALALMLAPLQAGPTSAENGMAAAMSSMKMTGCKGQPCPCEKTKPACDMKLGCAVGCVGFNLSHVISQSEHFALLREMSFMRLAETLVSIETVPLRRPPRV